MLLNKRFSIYTFIFHLFILSLFVFFENKKTTNEEIKEKRVVIIDDFEDSISAESIDNDDLIKKILSNENLNSLYTVEERLEKERQIEKERSENARIKNKKIKEEKEKIKLENERIKLEKEKNERIKLEKELKEKELKEKKLKEKELKRLKEKELKENDLKLKEDLLKKEIELKNKQKEEDLKKLKENKAIKEIKLKEEWLRSSESKRIVQIYKNDIQEKLELNWHKPFNSKSGWNCYIEIIQDNKGYIKSINETKCNPNNKDLIISVKNAALQASPLPLPKDMRLFDKTVIFNFTIE